MIFASQFSRNDFNSGGRVDCFLLAAAWVVSGRLLSLFPLFGLFCGRLAYAQQAGCFGTKSVEFFAKQGAGPRIFRTLVHFLNELLVMRGLSPVSPRFARTIAKRQRSIQASGGAVAGCQATHCFPGLTCSCHSGAYRYSAWSVYPISLVCLSTKRDRNSPNAKAGDLRSPGCARSGDPAQQAGDPRTAGVHPPSSLAGGGSGCCSLGAGGSGSSGGRRVGATPLGLVRFVPVLVESDDRVQRFGDTGLALGRSGLLLRDHPLVAVQQQRLGVGQPRLPGQTATQQAHGVVRGPMIGIFSWRIRKTSRRAAPLRRSSPGGEGLSPE